MNGLKYGTLYQQTHLLPTVSNCRGVTGLKVGDAGNIPKIECLLCGSLVQLRIFTTVNYFLTEIICAIQSVCTAFVSHHFLAQPT